METRPRAVWVTNFCYFLEHIGVSVSDSTFKMGPPGFLPSSP